MKNLLLIIAFVSLNLYLFASTGGGIGTPTSPAPDCIGNSAPGNTCAQATPICELNGYCGTTSSSYTADYWTELDNVFCGSIENNSFLTFTASSTTLSFDVWLTNSADGFGIQIMIFSSSQPCAGLVTSYNCWNTGTASAGPINVSATGLTPGQIYYMMIDGNAGDVCDYVIGANSGVSTPLTVVASATNICPGESVTLTASGGNGTYIWSASPYLSGSGSVVTVSPPSPGSYTFSTSSTFVSALCPASPTNVNTTIIVNSCGYEITAGNSGAICVGETVYLSTTALAGATAYSWTGPNGFTSNLQNPTGFTINTPGIYDYTVTTTLDGITISSTTTVIVNSGNVNAGPDQTICFGQNVTLTATNAATYNWDSSIVTNGVAFTPAVTATYTVNGTTGGCSSSDQVTVTVNPAAIISAGPDVTVCSGTTFACSGTGGITYVWDNNVVNGFAFYPDTITTTTPPTTTYTVIGIDANGCIGTDQMTITVIPAPIVNFTSNITSGCIPLTVVYDIINPSNNSYQWILGNGATSTNPDTATTTYTSAGCYDVTLVGTAPNGCIVQTTYPSMSCAFANPIADFIANPPILSILETTTNMFNSSIGANTYLWNFGDASGTSSLENPEHTFPPEIAASYQITLIAYTTNGCSDTAKFNIEVQDELVYYIPNTFTPDPNDEFNPVFKPIFTFGFDPNDYKLSIYNRWGELIFESNDVNYGWDGTYNGTHGIVKNDTYTWKIEFKTIPSDERKLLMGSVNLLR
jgi:gliding motility-associated-like protein